MLINTSTPPFYDVRTQRTMSFALDREAFVKIKGVGLDGIGGVRPSITFAGIAFCRRPYVRGYVPSLNNQYSNLGMKGVWPDK